MRTFCEVAVLEFLPAVRALVAKELLQTYKMTQTDVAKKLRISQPAVSYYLRELRGSKVKTMQSSEKMMQWIRNVAAEVSTGKNKVIDMHSFCKRIRDDFLSGRNLEGCTCCTH